jgi:hypothetical protein
LFEFFLILILTVLKQLTAMAVVMVVGAAMMLERRKSIPLTGI